MKKVVVIGGGIAGLSSAALLAKRGHQVTLLEKNSTLGGRARRLQYQDFNFDMGPSWYMMPEVFEKYFAIFNKKPSDFFKLIKLEPRYKIYYEDQSPLTIQNNLFQNKKLFDQIEPGAGQKLSQILKKLDKSYQLTLDLLYKPYQNIFDFLKPSVLKSALPFLLNINPFISYHHFVKKYFKDHRLQKIFEFPTVFLGGSPDNTPSFYSILSSADFTKKIWYPQGGIYQLVLALKNLCLQNRVNIITNSSVSQINIDHHQVRSITSNNLEYPADLIVSSSDYHHTDQSLLPKKYQIYSPKTWQNKTLAISSLLLYVGIKGRLKNTVHHNLYFSKNWQSNFYQIFKNPTWPENPSYYLSIRTHTDKTISPPHTSELFILVPLAPGLKDTPKIRKKYSQYIINHLENTLSEDIKSKIIFTKIYSHKNFQSDYNAYKGTALGLAHTLNQSLILRPPLKHPKIRNLYFTGQYTQPGVGLPMCLISAQLIDKIITNDLRSSPENF